MLQSLPVVMYHSVHTWHNRGLVISPELFEAHCRAMAQGGWRCASLPEAEDYLLRGKPLPAKTAWLTFDDGYLDNYVYAWPILEKYGLHGTVFATLEHLENSGPARLSLRDVWEGRATMDDLPVAENPMRMHPDLGFEERADMFLNWDEVQRMEASGVMHTAAHSLRHDKVFISPNYDDFFRPQRRGRTFDRVRGRILWGMPRFEIEAALASRAFIPSERLLDAVAELVPQDKVAAHVFFEDAEKVAKLDAMLKRFTPEELGRLESEAEMFARFREEFVRCKEILEAETQTPVRTFCWPWGKFSELAREAGKEAGFSIFVTTAAGANRPGRPDAVTRINVKARPPEELLGRLKLHTRPWLADIYKSLRFRWKWK